jgi:hypothetical protein
MTWRVLGRAILFKLLRVGFQVFPASSYRYRPQLPACCYPHEPPHHQQSQKAR